MIQIVLNGDGNGEQRGECVVGNGEQVVFREVVAVGRGKARARSRWVVGDLVEVNVNGRGAV